MLQMLLELHPVIILSHPFGINTMMCIESITISSDSLVSIKGHYSGSWHELNTGSLRAALLYQHTEETIQ